jgi:hypothetical protein
LRHPTRATPLKGRHSNATCPNRCAISTSRHFTLRYTVVHCTTTTLRHARQPLIQRIPQVLRHRILQILRHLIKPLLKGMLLFLPQRTSLFLRQLPEPRSELMLGPSPLAHRVWCFPTEGPVSCVICCAGTVLCVVELVVCFA